MLVVTAVLASSVFIQPMATTSNMGVTEAPIIPHTFAGYDSDNINATFLYTSFSLGNNSGVEGIFNMTMDIELLNDPVNLTVFVEDTIYPDYNLTNIGSGIQNVTIDSTTLAEGPLNFTLLFSDNTTGTNERQSYFYTFDVDNHGAPHVDILSPVSLGNFTGLDDLFLNITSDYSEVYLNITIDGEITPEYNQTVVSSGAANYTINGSRYENGHHDIEVLVYTEEGLDSTDSITLFFLDHLRFWLRGVTQFNRLVGDVEITIVVDSPYDSVLLSAFVDGELASDVSNVTIDVGTSTFTLDTTRYSEGEHTFTFKAFDAFGHFWMTEWELIVDNHGIPLVEFVSPDEDLVVGYVAFTIDIESTWDTVTVFVYIDDVSSTNYTDVVPGEFTFYIITSDYSKWEHVIRVVVETDEGETTEIEETFGFSNMRIEEIASLAILIGAALVIPLYRKKNGEPIRPAIILDFVFVAVLVIAYLIMGITSIPLAIWHINLASIWILGGILVFMNWVLPLLKEEYEN